MNVLAPDGSMALRPDTPRAFFGQETVSLISTEAGAWRGWKWQKGACAPRLPQIKSIGRRSS